MSWHERSNNAPKNVRVDEERLNPVDDCPWLNDVAIASFLK